MLGYTITPTAVNLFIGGRMRTITNTHVNFKAVTDTLLEYGRRTPGYDDSYEKRLMSLLDIPAYIARATEGKIKVCDNAVLYNDTPVHGVVAARLLALLSSGHDVKPLARFMDRLFSNPVDTAADELYTWMEKANLPLTDDGCFLAFKKVQDNYKSYHDGRTDNSIGAKLPVLAPDDYDTDRYATCSRGYHFCAYEYLGSYFGNQGRVVVCKVAPEDVVAIPADHNSQKGRAKTYEIIGEIPEDEAQRFFDNRPVVDEFGTYATGSAAADLDEDVEDVDDPWYDSEFDGDPCDGPDDDTAGSQAVAGPQQTREQEQAQAVVIKIVDAHGMTAAKRLLIGKIFDELLSRIIKR